MAFTFMSDGIPIVYYGQEQGFSGSSDPVSHDNHPHLTKSNVPSEQPWGPMALTIRSDSFVPAYCHHEQGCYFCHDSFMPMLTVSIAP